MLVLRLLLLTVLAVLLLLMLWLGDLVIASLALDDFAAVLLGNLSYKWLLEDLSTARANQQGRWL